ncbi:MAG: hypothetical protein WAN05_07580 [Roseiarcus sp.]
MIVDSHQRDYPPGDDDAEWIMGPTMPGPRLDRRETDKVFGASAARCCGREANA